MRNVLPFIRRSPPLRVLAVVACWMLASLPVFAANMPMMAPVSGMPARHAAGTTIHQPGSHCDLTSMPPGCCADQHHKMNQLDCASHCTMSCMGVLSRATFDFVFYANEWALAVADAPSPIGPPPLRPPAG